MDKIALSKRIRAARKEQNLTSDALSELCEKSPVFIRQIESGKRLPSLPSFVTLCNKLNVSADYLLADSLITISKNDTEAILDRLHAFSPKKAELAIGIISTIISQFENE
ncbi:MAG: helix-turn-helix domain-containing protein [Lachnospiraceae bacterium]